MLDFSVIIVNYKTPKMTADCVRSVLEHTQDVGVEVIVVDNHSQDDSKIIVTGEFPSITWIDMGYNAGFARANNAGMRVAKGQNMVLLNSDTLLIDDLLAKTAAHLEQEPDVVACGGIQLYPDLTERPFFKSLATFRRFQFIYPPSAFIDKVLLKLYPDSQHLDSEQVDWIPAAFLVARRTTVAQAGMLDEQFFMYGEDTDWNCRLGRVGKLKVYNDCRYIHYEWGSHPERKGQVITVINRILPQITVSNLVWTRKEHGVGQFLILMFNYWLMVPVYFAWKMALNVKDLTNPFAQLENQVKYAQSVGVVSRFFGKILFKKKYFYKI
jgi:GT2 family glycosyltransferase